MKVIVNKGKHLHSWHCNSKHAGSDSYLITPSIKVATKSYALPSIELCLDKAFQDLMQ